MAKFGLAGKGPVVVAPVLDVSGLQGVVVLVASTRAGIPLKKISFWIFSKDNFSI